MLLLKLCRPRVDQRRCDVRLVANVFVCGWLEPEQRFAARFPLVAPEKTASPRDLVENISKSTRFHGSPSFMGADNFKFSVWTF